jgi:hypothetical protein
MKEFVVNAQSPSLVWWDRPVLPAMQLQQAYNNPLSAKRRLLGMRHVHLGEGLLGLSVSCDNFTNMSIHAHYEPVGPTNPCPEELEWSYNKTFVWCYFPVARKEKICGVWVIINPAGLSTVAVRTTLLYQLVYSHTHIN